MDNAARTRISFAFIYCAFYCPRAPNVLRVRTMPRTLTLFPLRIYCITHFTLCATTICIPLFYFLLRRHSAATLPALHTTRTHTAFIRYVIFGVGCCFWRLKPDHNRHPSPPSTLFAMVGTRQNVRLSVQNFARTAVHIARAVRQEQGWDRTGTGQTFSKTFVCFCLFCGAPGRPALSVSQSHLPLYSCVSSLLSERDWDRKGRDWDRHRHCSFLSCWTW